MTPTRIVLIDDHPLILAGIQTVLLHHEQVTVVGSFQDARRALVALEELAPDVVVMDLSMPGMSGLEAMRSLFDVYPQAQALLFTAYDQKEYILEVVRAGARGYVLKDASPDDLVRAIEVVHGGGTYFTAEVSQVLVNDYLEKARRPNGERVLKLTRREKEVLALITDGLLNKEIAQQLFISVRTVETHRERIMKKLKIRSVAGLTKYAIAEGLTEML